MENQAVIDRIIESSLQGAPDSNKLTFYEFVKCISNVTSSNFEEKVSLFFKVFQYTLIFVDDRHRREWAVELWRSIWAVSIISECVWD